MTDRLPGLALQVGQLGRVFNGCHVLQDVHFQIPAGQFVAIVGRSGCGKSTLLRLLAGLDQPDAGQLSADNRPLAQVREAIRLMFQEARLLPWKRVVDNVRLGLPDRWNDQALAVLEAVGLLERAHDWPAALSGGQKQRVALARALIHKPRLLLLDEPLGALDALTRIEMQRLIEQLWQQYGFTVVLVTHDVSEAVMLADRVIMIEQGQISLDLMIDLPRPRRRDNTALAALEAHVLGCILGEAKPGGVNVQPCSNGVC